MYSSVPCGDGMSPDALVFNAERQCHTCPLNSLFFVFVVFVVAAGNSHEKLRGPEAVLQSFGQGFQVYAGECCWVS